MKRSLSVLLTVAVTIGSVATAVGALHSKGERAAELENVLSTTELNNRANDHVMKASEKARQANALPRIPMRVSNSPKATATSTGVMRELDTNLEIQGTVVASDAWSGDYLYGFYTLPTNNDEPLVRVNKHKGGYVCGYYTSDGSFYGASIIDAGWLKGYFIDKYETDTWERLSSTQVGKTLVATDIAVDPISGLAYGCFPSDSEGFEWAIANYESLGRETIATLAQKLEGVAVDKTGQFYAVGTDAAFYKLDKATGELTKIGDTGLALKYQTSACFNDRNGNVLMTYCNDNEAGLAEIDITTGAATIISTFPENEQVDCLTIVNEGAEAGAPAAPELEVSCFEGAMAVDVILTMPTTLFDGSDATGETFDYSVMSGTTEVLKGQAVAGAVVEQNVPLSISGQLTFVAVAINDNGPSPRVTASCYIGKGSPLAPENVQLAWADGKATLTWDAVTESADNGYLNAVDVTYNVVNEAGEVIADDLATTSYTFDLPEPESYTSIQYGVQAVYGSKMSVVAYSNKVDLGSLSAPLSMDMTEVDNFNLHTVNDVNADGKTWQYYGNGEVTRYQYSSANDGDDWLVSPAIYLEAGKAYMFTATVSAGNNRYAERISVAYGQGKSPEDLSTELVAPTMLTSTDKVEISGALKPETSGNYYIGFHAISDADRYTLNLYKYSVGEPMAGTTPDAVSNLTITRDADGAPKATIAFSAPAKTVAGTAISGNVSIKIERNNTEVATLEVAPGAEYSHVDEVPRTGTYNYTVTPVAADGTVGIASTMKVFVGATTPEKVESFSLAQTAPGVFELTWEPVTTDTNGDAISPANITYELYSTVPDSWGDVDLDEILVDGITGDSYTYTTEAKETQSFLTLALVAVNRDVNGSAAVATTLAGTPYELPVVYSGKNAEYFLASSGSGDVFTSNREFLCEAQDGDDSYYVVQHRNLGVTKLETGLIDLTAEAPAIKFFIYKTDEVDANTTEIYVMEGNNVTLVGAVDNNDLEGTGWFPVMFDLSAYKDKVVRIRLESATHAFDASGTQARKYSIYDNIRITNNLAQDLSVKVVVPAQVETGKEFAINVNVSNDGSEAAGAYSVTLLRNGKEVESHEFDALEVFGMNKLTFADQILTVLDDLKNTYVVKVAYEPDQDTNNNTAKAEVTRKPSLLPGVTGFTGENTANGNSLSWDAFEAGQISIVETTESFENAEFGSDEVEGWIFVDVDKEATSSNNYTPNIPGFVVGCEMSFLVLDGDVLGINAHSGSKFIADMFRVDDGMLDDWAISPELSGEAQTISFFARSASSSYPEKIQLWYSTGSTEIEDFIQLTNFGSINPPTEWTKYMAALPSGAKRFAVRSCAEGSYMLLLDDFTFSRMDVFNGEHKGYNVYCDLESLNTDPIADNAYLHSDGEPHTYHVSAVYAEGESELSEPLTIGVSGIDSVDFGSVKVAVEGSAIVVTGAGECMVYIYSIDGRTIYSAAGDARVDVAPAIYLVNVNRNTVKVVVR